MLAKGHAGHAGHAGVHAGSGVHSGIGSSHLGASTGGYGTGFSSQLRETKRAYRSSFSKPGPVENVRSYTRQDGTVVRAYTRSAPSAAPTRSYPSHIYLAGPSTAPTAAPRQTASTTLHGSERRSVVAKDEFKRFHPCPSTGKGSGPCPGYVIDHRTALACGGADSPSNMQWQTTEEAKAKDKWERKGCR